MKMKKKMEEYKEQDEEVQLVKFHSSVRGKGTWRIGDDAVHIYTNTVISTHLNGIC